MDSKRALVIVLDAFSSRYLTKKLSPYLYDLSRNWFYSPMQPLFAYEGIRWAILTGLSPGESGIFGDHVFSERKANMIKLNILKGLLKISDAVPDDYLNKVTRYALFKLFKEDYGTPHLIPPNLLDYFSVVKRPLKKAGQEDLFTILSNHGKKGTWVEPKINALEGIALKKAIKSLKVFDLVFVKLNSLDRLGHKYGPLSSEVRNRVKYLDSLLYENIKKALNEYKDLLVIVMSDHGMCPVHSIINIEQKLRQLPIKVKQDYFVYLGTTVTLFWFKNKVAREHVEKLLDGLNDYGKVLSDEDLRNLGLGGIDRSLYGELIFALYEGNIFHPDFYYRRKPPKGMHGYAFYSYDAPILIVSPHIHLDFKRKKEASIVNIAPTILEFLGIPLPPRFEGKTLVFRRY